MPSSWQVNQHSQKSTFKKTRKNDGSLFITLLRPNILMLSQVSLLLHGWPADPWRSEIPREKSRALWDFPLVEADDRSSWGSRISRVGKPYGQASLPLSNRIATNISMHLDQAFPIHYVYIRSTYYVSRFKIQLLMQAEKQGLEWHIGRLGELGMILRWCANWMPSVARYEICLHWGS